MLTDEVGRFLNRAKVNNDNFMIKLGVMACVLMSIAKPLVILECNWSIQEMR